MQNYVFLQSKYSIQYRSNIFMCYKTVAAQCLQDKDYIIYWENQ